MSIKPQIGLGTFPFSGAFSPVSADAIAKIISEFLSTGGRYIETAPVYNIKPSILTEILSDYNRDSYYLASKCVTGRDKDGQVIRSGKRDYIIQQCEQVLTNLDVSYLDLLQTHVVAEDTTIRETAETLRFLQEQGMIHQIGVSNVSLEQLKRYGAVCQVDYVQNRFSLVHQENHNSIEAYCVEKDIYLNPYQIIERGLLTSYPTISINWQKNDVRRLKQEYGGDAYRVIRVWVEEQLLPLAELESIPLETLMAAWALKQQQVQVAVIGVTKVEQLHALQNGAQIDLNAATCEKIDQAYHRLIGFIRTEYGQSLETFRGLSN